MLSSPQRRVLAWVWVTATLFLLAVAAATAWLLQASRHDALARADGQVAQLVSGAEVDLNRTLISVDLLLAGLATPLLFSVHTIVSMDFATAVIPG